MTALWVKNGLKIFSLGLVFGLNSQNSFAATVDVSTKLIYSSSGLCSQACKTNSIVLPVKKIETDSATGYIKPFKKFKHDLIPDEKLSAKTYAIIPGDQLGQGQYEMFPNKSDIRTRAALLTFFKKNQELFNAAHQPLNLSDLISPNGVVSSKVDSFQVHPLTAIKAPYTYYVVFAYFDNGKTGKAVKTRAQGQKQDNVQNANSAYDSADFQKNGQVANESKALFRDDLKDVKFRVREINFVPKPKA